MMINKGFTANVAYTHTEGEPTCIINSGITYPPGSTILEKREFLERNYDWLRCALMREPRGHKDMYGVFVTPPSSPDFDAGLIWIDGTQYSHMCGHGTIAVSMALVALGWAGRPVPDHGTIQLRFETTAGTVISDVHIADGKVMWCRFENVPAYVHMRDIPLDLPEFGRVTADIVWGGNYFGIIDWRGKTPRISPENGRKLSEIGVLARQILRDKVELRHPILNHITDLNYMTLWQDPILSGARYKNVHIFSDGQLDRSPGGTGTSAMMTLLEARGELGFHEPVLAEGLLGSGAFEGCLIGETKLGDVRAVRPTVKGKAGLLGQAQWTIDREDQVSAGFLIG
jgi:proline racemase